jgi:hypothetical protein
MPPFSVKDCALSAIATGERAQSLRELRDRLERTDNGCLYYHFWAARLRPKFDDPEYLNDFAAWAYYGLHDRVLAERLALLSPTDFDSLEDLRRELLDVIEERLEESELAPWAAADRQFHFIRSTIVVFDAGRRIDGPQDLPSLIPTLSEGSIFYHFIDARRRTPERTDDFSEWLQGLDGDWQGLVDDLRALDPYFSSLVTLREHLESVAREHLSR